MSEIGYGYGSEWHLLRYLGYHRGALDAAVKCLMGDVREIEWFDFRFDPTRKYLDAELKGVEFLMDDESAKQTWPDFWPTSGNPPNWDAVGLLTLTTNNLAWLLVEAKAHLNEIDSSCGAKNPGSVAMIDLALRQTKCACGVAEDRDWITRYYQYANRLAVLYHFNRHAPGARLLNIYFTGDHNPNAECPQHPEQWRLALKARDSYLGLAGNSPLEARVYSLFLPVCGQNAGYGGVRA